MNFSLALYWPILLAVFSDIFYQICAKSTPSNLNPFASLTMTYLVGAVISTVIFFGMHLMRSADIKRPGSGIWYHICTQVSSAHMETEVQILLTMNSRLVLAFFTISD